MNSPNLYQNSRDILARHKGIWPEVARECGVSYSWISKFVNGKIEDAGAKRLERICAFLHTKERKLARRAAPITSPP